MEELVPNTVEASSEKHIPVIGKAEAECGFKVQVGSDAHPMTPEHYIAFIYVQTLNGGQMLNISDKPEAEFCSCKDKPVAVFAYCNLHGLWLADIKADCKCCCNE
jgi:superoxide reductase